MITENRKTEYMRENLQATSFKRQEARGKKQEPRSKQREARGESIYYSRQQSPRVAYASSAGAISGQAAARPRRQYQNPRDTYIGNQRLQNRRGGAQEKSRLAIRLRKILLNVLIVAAILGIGIFLCLTVFFKTAEITLSGATRYNEQELIAASGLEIGDNIFLSDKEQASQRIIEAFPYIESAYVNFSIPDKIEIEIVEAKGSYAVETGGKYLLVSTKGRILETRATKYEEVMLLLGARLKTTEPGRYIEFDDDKVSGILDSIYEATKTVEFDKVVSINVENTLNMTLNYDNRINVLLGNSERLEYKIKTAKAIIFDKLDPEKTGIIQGELDVSRCHETEKSYFNENTL